MSFPKIGNKAPAFTLLNQQGVKVSLSSFVNKNHVVVYFYPKAMTPGCTVQACGIRDAQQEMKARDTVVLGLSPDPVDKLEKFRVKHELNFDLLSDESLVVANQYGVWGLKKFMGKEFMGILRTTFIIGKDGKLKHIFDKVKTKTHHQDVCDYIDQHLQ